MWVYFTIRPKRYVSFTIKHKMNIISRSFKSVYIELCKIYKRALYSFQNVHWTDLIASSDKQTGSVTDGLHISEMERKRRESVWELFKSECVFLIDHLMVLKHVSRRFGQRLFLYYSWCQETWLHILLDKPHACYVKEGVSADLPINFEDIQ